MAVIKDSEANGEAKYTINNGDLTSLNEIKDKYKLRDSNDAITFAIGVLKQAGGRPVTIQTDLGSTTSLLPSQQLRRNDNGQTT